MFKKQSFEENENLAKEIISAIGIENIIDVENCISRVRITVSNNEQVDELKLSKIKSFGFSKFGKNSIQIVLGNKAEQVVSFIKEHLNNEKP